MTITGLRIYMRHYMPKSLLPFSMASYTACEWTVTLSLATIFIADWFTPLGFGHGMLYNPIILMSLICGRRAMILGVGLSAALLTLIGTFISPNAPDMLAVNTIFANRGFAITLITVTTAVSLWLQINLQRLNSEEEKLIALEQQLSEQQHLLRITSQMGHLGGWTVSLPEKRVSWTDEVANMHHLPPGYHPSIEEAIQFYHPDYREHVRKLVRDCIEQGIAFDDEVQLLVNGQDTLWLRIMGTAVHDHQGKIIRIQGAIQDISKHKQIDDLIRNSHENFFDLANAMPIIIWSAQANGVLDYANHAFSDFSGLDITELVQPGRWLSILHPNDYERTEAYWRESVNTGKDYIIECRIRRKDGEYRWHLTRAKPVRNELSVITKWYGSMIDIHEHKILTSEHQIIVDRLSHTQNSL